MIRNDAERASRLGESSLSVSSCGTMLPPTSSLNAYNQVLLADPGDLDVEIASGEIVGDVPAELKGGIWWGNGPSRLRVGDRIVHPFDGHGYMRALRFLDDGSVGLRARYVRTAVFEAEHSAGRLLERGLATMPSDSWLANIRAPIGRNVANTHVLPWNGDILALWEGGHPHRLDPRTLETLGTQDFHGALHHRELFSAHARVDPVSKHMIGLSPRIRGRAVDYTVREIDPSGHQTERRTERLDAFSVAHDFVITPNFVVVLESSIDVSLLGMLSAFAARSTIIEALSRSGRNARALVIPRKEGPTRIVDLGRPLVFVHHVNAWEVADELVIVTCALPEFTFGSEFGFRGSHREFDTEDDGKTRQEVVRFDVRGTSATERIISRTSFDFPAVRRDRIGSATRTVYGVVIRQAEVATPFSALARIDLETGETCTSQAGDWFVGEPVLVPRGQAEDDTWVAAMFYSPDACEFRVFDGQSIGAGPVCRVPLPIGLPYGFHGFWQCA